MKIARIAIHLRSRGGAVAHDLLMVPVAWLGAFWLQFNPNLLWVYGTRIALSS